MPGLWEAITVSLAVDSEVIDLVKTEASIETGALQLSLKTILINISRNT